MVSQKQCFFVYVIALLVMGALMVGIQRTRLPATVLKGFAAGPKRYGSRMQSAAKEVEGTSRSQRNRTWEEQQAARKTLVRRMCRTLSPEAGAFSPPLAYSQSSKGPASSVAHLSVFSTFLVIDSLKVIFCYIPKVGCTSWKRLFLALQEGGNHGSMTDIGQRASHLLASQTFPSLASFPVDEADRLLATYRKFVFVRNPFERVLSAYQDKFQNDYPASRLFRSAWSRSVLRGATRSGRAYRTLLKAQRRADGTINITFPQFVRFLSTIDGPSEMRHANSHWKQMYGLCHPCLIEYDWIGSYDSLQTDAESILAAVGADPGVRFPNFSTNPTGSSDAETLRRYYSRLTTQEIASLRKHFRLDFSLFGFDIPQSVRELLDERDRGSLATNCTVKS